MAKGLTPLMRKQKASSNARRTSVVRNIPVAITPTNTPTSTHEANNSRSSSRSSSPPLPELPETPETAAEPSGSSEAQNRDDNIEEFMAEQRSFNERAGQLLQQLSDQVLGGGQATRNIQKKAPLPLKLTVRSFYFLHRTLNHKF